MQFLVTAEYVEPGPLFPPEQIVPFIEGQVIPSLEMLAEWEEEGKIRAGGVFAGQRAGAFVLEASSHEEVGQVLTSLPFWAVLKWQVIPLQSNRSAVERERKVVEQIKASRRR